MNVKDFGRLVSVTKNVNGNAGNSVHSRGHSSQQWVALPLADVVDIVSLRQQQQKHSDYPGTGFGSLG